MRIEVEKFPNNSLKILVRFEPASNFRPESLTWVPKKEEVDHISRTLQAIDEHNRIHKGRNGSDDASQKTR